MIRTAPTANAWLLLIIATLGCMGVAEAANLTVGPGQKFGRIEDAYRAAKPGDTIAVFPPPEGQAYRKTALLIQKPRIRFVAVRQPGDPLVKIDGDGFNYRGARPVPRAVFGFEPGSDGGHVEGFEIYNAHNQSHNGAAVRVNGASHVTIRHCHIHGNDMGIMANGGGKHPMQNLRIEFCELDHNGNKEEPGLNHNLYLGGDSVVLHGCHVHHPITGHNVKSRAHYTRVEFSYIHDSLNREFDLVDHGSETGKPGSHAVLLGNLIVKGIDVDNKTVVHFGQDQGGPHDGDVYLLNNTIITPHRSPVVDLSAAKAGAVLRNNLIFNPGARDDQQLVNARSGASLKNVRGHNNWLGPGMVLPGGTALDAGKQFLAPAGTASPFVAPAQLDYRLNPGAKPALDAGVAWAELGIPPVPGAPTSESKPMHYVHPLATADRQISGAPDLGAYELGADWTATANVPPRTESGGSANVASTQKPAQTTSPARPRPKPVLKLELPETWKEKCREQLVAQVKAGKRPKVYLTLFGDKPEQVKVVRADDQSMDIQVKGNAMPWQWEQLIRDDYINLARACFDDSQAASHLLLAVFLACDGKTADAEHHFATAIVMNQKVTREQVNAVRAALKGE